jgi:hypothetical protein
MSAGCSGAPLARKLGLGPGARVVAEVAPEGYRDWLAPLPEGVALGGPVSRGTDVVHLFVDRRDELARIAACAGLAQQSRLATTRRNRP